MSKRRSGKQNIANKLADVTLNQFANSTVRVDRPKKYTINVNTSPKKLEEEIWDATPDEDVDKFVREVDEQGNVHKTGSRRRKKTRVNTDEIRESDGKDYPIDIWFLISEYIRPEDVGTFAAICKTSYEVICTARFWYSLYRRYCKIRAYLPNRLQPECLTRKYGLRASVIRALYHAYPLYQVQPFTWSTRNGFTPLTWMTCESHWYQKDGDRWQFFFKMKTSNVPPEEFVKTNITQLDLVNMLDDVLANPDQHCRVLQVNCEHFINIPFVAGQVLTSMTLGKRNNFQHIQLCFAPAIQNYSRGRVTGAITVNLEPVINYLVLEWWHPLYPHSYTLKELLIRL